MHLKQLFDIQLYISRGQHQHQKQTNNFSVLDLSTSPKAVLRNRDNSNQQHIISVPQIELCVSPAPVYVQTWCWVALQVTDSSSSILADGTRGS